MTIDKLLGLSSTEFLALTDEQLLEYFKEYRNITRPELVVKEEVSAKRTVSVKSSKLSSYNAALAKAKAVAEQYGLKLNI